MVIQQMLSYRRPRYIDTPMEIIQIFCPTVGWNILIDSYFQLLTRFTYVASVTLV